jgi:hypothetical protein
MKSLSGPRLGGGATGVSFFVISLTFWWILDVILILIESTELGKFIEPSLKFYIRSSGWSKVLFLGCCPKSEPSSIVRASIMG